MGTVKVSIFQKDLRERILPETLKKLNGIKSDFLLLPEYFYADERVKNYEDLLKLELTTISWLQKLSKIYKGTIIGGTIVHSDGDNKKIGIPIIRNGHLISWYHKTKLSTAEKKIAVPGDDSAIFILGSIRFALQTYADLSSKSYLKKLSQEQVKLVYVLGNFGNETSKEMVSENLLSLSKQYDFNIVLCCAVGKSFQCKDELRGYSLVATPHGVSWQISQEETKEQIIKTVILIKKDGHC